MTKIQLLPADTSNCRPMRWHGLQQLTRAQAMVETAFAIFGGEVDVRHDAGTLVIVPGTRSAVAEDYIYLEIWIGNRSFDVYADIELIQDQIRAGGFKQDVRNLSDVSLTLVCEHFIAPFVTGLETMFGGDFIVVDTYFTTTRGPRDGLYLGAKNENGTSHSFVVSVPEGAVLSLADMIKQNAAGRSDLRANIVKSHAASYRGETFQMLAMECAALQAGDGVMLSPNWSPETISKIVINNSLAIPVTRAEAGFKISGAPATLPYAENNEENSSMKHQPNMEVEISIELARARFELETLANMTEDAILPFPTTIGHRVTLLCNEERVAVGELVEIDGTFGVRIEKVN